MKIRVASRTDGILWRDGFYIPHEGVELDIKDVPKDVLARWRGLSELIVEDVEEARKAKDEKS